MTHLKLGTYSFVIVCDELGLTSGVQKEFSRDELPANLKPLYDIIQKPIPCEKSIFVQLIGDSLASGYLKQISAQGYELLSSDGRIITMFNNGEKISITVNFY